MSTYCGIIAICEGCSEVQVCFHGLCMKCQDKEDQKDEKNDGD